MSYHIYTTPGIVLKRRVFGESDTVLYILTRDLGLIMASARATRTPQSKLKGSLQEYSLSTISLVKGKNGWKITNAVLLKNYYFDSPEYARKFFAKISLFLQKTITGEMPHKEVYEIVHSGFEALLSKNQEEVPYLETLMVLRIMKELGYVVSDSETSKYFDDNEEWGMEVIQKVLANNLRLVSIINNAIKESQL